MVDTRFLNRYNSEVFWEEKLWLKEHFNRMLNEGKQPMDLEQKQKHGEGGEFSEADEGKVDAALLPKHERLRKGKEIKEVLRRKEKEAGSPLLYLTARLRRETHGQNSRLVTITTKNLGNSVRRNRIRRILLAAYAKIKRKNTKEAKTQKESRFNRDPAKAGQKHRNFDMVIIPKKTIVDANFGSVVADFEKVLKKAGII